KLLETGRLAILQGVGYPNPNRSHFESMAIWHTARFDPDERGDLGWLGRALDGGGQPAGGIPASVFVGGGQLPVALRGRRAVASALTRLDDFLLAPGVNPKPAAASAEPMNDLAAFLQRSALDAYATAERMAELAHGPESGARYPTSALAGQ